jgi:hypothetical protein
MDAVFKKMNFKNAQNVVVINAPQSFEANIDAMQGLTTFVRNFENIDKTDFVIAFCTKQSEVDGIAAEVAEKLEGDGLLWYAYPKGTSKKYKCEFNRDNGWTLLGSFGFEPVRMVAIDDDWSALRFRRAGYIKTMTRSFAISDEGKEKLGK